MKKKNREFGYTSFIGHVFDLFPGVQASFVDKTVVSHLPIEQDFEDKHKVMKIYYCFKGRFECEFEDNACFCMTTGDMAVVMLSHDIHACSFSPGDYFGLSLYIDLECAQEFLDQTKLELGMNLNEIYAKLKLSEKCYVVRSSSIIKELFKQMLEIHQDILVPYYKLKILELLVLLNSEFVQEANHLSCNFPVSVVDKINDIANHLKEHYHEKITIKELAKLHGISETTLKNCFKEVYGKPVYSFLKAYRISIAVDLLTNTKHKISYVGKNVGYQSPSKFIAAFKSVKGSTPFAFRKSLGIEVDEEKE